MPVFKVGDTVRLKSGSPLMTVTAVGRGDDGSQVVWTHYFTNDDKESRGHYPAAALETDGGDVVSNG